MQLLNILLKTSFTASGMDHWFITTSISWKDNHDLWLMNTIDMSMQIFPINIKGLAGSVATLGNWFTCWVITMTTNLLLEWSGGGLPPVSLSLCLCVHKMIVCQLRVVLKIV